jgi:hypothetical protein
MGWRGPVWGRYGGEMNERLIACPLPNIQIPSLLFLSIQIFSISQLTKLSTLRITGGTYLGKQLIQVFYDLLKIVT